MSVDLRLGDCVSVMRGLPSASVDAVCTDPPAGIAFLGKEWDRDKGGRDAWVRWLAERMAEALRVARPGSHALVWALPRTSHWTALALEDAGWTINDRIAHIFGTGFPKHKSKLKPATEDWWLATKPGGAKWLNVDQCRINPASARHVSGACTPDSSPEWLRDCVRRIAAELRGYSTGGTGRLHDAAGRDGRRPSGVGCERLADRLYPNGVWCGLNWSSIQDSRAGCPSCLRSCGERLRRLEGAARESAPSLADALERIGSDLLEPQRNQSCRCGARPSNWDVLARVVSLLDPQCRLTDNDESYSSTAGNQGRWPTNLALTHHPDCKSCGTKRVKGIAPPGRPTRGQEREDRENWRFAAPTSMGYADPDGLETVPAWQCVESCPVAEMDRQSGERKSGSRAAGVRKGGTNWSGPWSGDGGPAIEASTGGASRFYPTFAWDAADFLYCPKASRSERGEGNTHETVKPLALCRWLVRLVTPADGTVLDPFLGSGTFALAALDEGFNFIGVEKDERYFEMARRRIAAEAEKTALFEVAS